MRPERGSSAPSEEEVKFYTPVSSSRGIQNHPQRVTISPTPRSILDQEYAGWFTPITPTKERPDPLPKTLEPKKAMDILSPSTNKVNMVHRSIISTAPGGSTESLQLCSHILFYIYPATQLQEREQ